jgi:hypothetical protein
MKFATPFKFVFIIAVCAVVGFVFMRSSAPHRSSPALGGGGRGGRTGAEGSEGGAAGAAQGSSSPTASTGTATGAGGAQKASGASGSTAGGGQQKPAEEQTQLGSKKAPGGFFSRLVHRFQALFGGEAGRGMGFFQKLSALFQSAPLEGESAEGSTAASSAAPASAAAKPAQVAGPDRSVQNEIDRQIKENLQQTLDQQRMMREMQQIQRQQLENTKMMIQTQQQLRQSTENARSTRGSAAGKR